MNAAIDLCSDVYERIVAFQQALDNDGDQYMMQLDQFLTCLSKSIFAVFMQYTDVIHWQWQYSWQLKTYELIIAFCGFEVYLNAIRSYLQEISVLWCVSTVSGRNRMPDLMESALCLTPLIRKFLVGDQTDELLRQGKIHELYGLVRTADMALSISHNAWNLFYGTLLYTKKK